MSRYKVSFALLVGLGIVASPNLIKAEGQQAASKRAEPKTTAASPSIVRWKAAENNTWRWYERENRTNGHWELTAITTPVHKRTGQRYTGATGYLDENVVPIEVRRQGRDVHESSAVESSTAEESGETGRPDTARRERGGRPPSKWLRSLNANELREWLKTIEVPEAGVEGMTYWEHLTRDHSFDPKKIEGLTEEEQAKLHAAAHYGY
jgi:hypothetical protein